MKLEEFQDTFDGKGEYSAKCSGCKRYQHVRTQHDNGPEYYTDVYIECPCGEWVNFRLPVN